MLVFQKTDFEHIKQNVEDPKRCGRPFAWLVQVIVDINRYLPDDWRMTRTNNTFRIQIIPDDGKPFALVGYSYRHGKKGGVLHIVATVFAKHFFDKFDLQKALQDQGVETISNKKMGAFIDENPEVVTPNAYYFSPIPDGFSSPLFVRQYEKVSNIADRSEAIQYHRIHPLHREGMDLGRYLWVSWSTRGDVQILEPPSDVHGRDYWTVPRLTRYKGDSALHSYRKHYDDIVSEFGITSKMSGTMGTGPFLTEHKFLVPGTGQNAAGVYRTIEKVCQQLKGAGKEAAIAVTAFPQRRIHTDSYFDDASRSLHAASISLRIRETEDINLLTLKRRATKGEESGEDGLYSRFEETLMISKEQKRRIQGGERLHVFPFALLDCLLPDRRVLAKVFRVKTARRRIVMEYAAGQVEIRLDEIRYKIAGNERGPFFEIEMLTRFGNENDASSPVFDMQRNLGLLPSGMSKYERGHFLCREHDIAGESSNSIKKVIIDTDCGVDDALALILALRSSVLDVVAVTAVSGNVHVDKVVPNVFRVFQTLGLNNPPPVFRGSESPLCRDLRHAASVHGDDGLGDAPDGGEPVTVRPEKGFAWEEICRAGRENPGQVTLITLGPLTNVARAIQHDAEGVMSLKEIVSMGGVFFGVGNVAPDAEFNVHTDPEAAAAVVDFCRESMKRRDGHGLPLTFVGLDVTHQVKLRRDVLASLQETFPENRIIRFVTDISKKYMDFYEGNEGLCGCYLHDPLAVAYVVNPAFLETEAHIVKVETKGDYTSGMIFPDDRPTRNTCWRNPEEAVIRVATRVQRQAFEEWLIKHLVETSS